MGIDMGIGIGIQMSIDIYIDTVIDMGIACECHPIVPELRHTELAKRPLPKSRNVAVSCGCELLLAIGP